MACRGARRQQLLSCTKHISLKPRSYDISGQLAASIQNGTLSAQLQNGSYPKVEWDDDGCSSILAAIIASTLFTPIVGIPAGIVASDFIDRLIELHINSAFRDNAGKEWHIRIP